MKQSEEKSVCLCVCIRRLTHPIFHLFDSCFFFQKPSLTLGHSFTLSFSLSHTRRSAGLSLFLNPGVTKPVEFVHWPSVTSWLKDNHTHRWHVRKAKLKHINHILT